MTADDQLCHAVSEFDLLIERALRQDVQLMREYGATEPEVRAFIERQRKRYAQDKARAMIEVAAFLFDAPARMQ